MCKHIYMEEETVEEVNGKKLPPKSPVKKFANSADNPIREGSRMTF